MGQQQTRVDFNLEELQKTYNFTKRQLIAWYEDFTLACPSGRMTKQKFQIMFSEYFPPSDKTHLIDYVFNAFNETRDGMLTFRDFVRAIYITTKGTPEEKLDFAFDIYDYDNDGVVIREDMLDVLRAVYRYRVKHKGVKNPKMEEAEIVNRFFRDYNKERDDQLRRYEFVNGLLNNERVVKLLELKIKLKM